MKGERQGCKHFCLKSFFFRSLFTHTHARGAERGEGRRGSEEDEEEAEAERESRGRGDRGSFFGGRTLFFFSFSSAFSFCSPPFISAAAVRALSLDPLDGSLATGASSPSSFILSLHKKNKRASL